MRISEWINEQLWPTWQRLPSTFAYTLRHRATACACIHPQCPREEKTAAHSSRGTRWQTESQHFVSGPERIHDSSPPAYCGRRNGSSCAANEYLRLASAQPRGGDPIGNCRHTASRSPSCRPHRTSNTLCRL